MDLDDNSVHLIGYRSSSPKPNGRRRNKYSAGREVLDGEDGYRMHVSDSELEQKNKEDMERSTVFSDVLSDSLPSVRAHLAASQMYSRSHRKEQWESSMNEEQPLLGTTFKQEEAGTPSTKTQTATGLVDHLGPTSEPVEGTASNMKYSSISTRLLTKRKKRRAKLLAWLNRGKVVFLTALIVASVIFFGVNSEHLDEYRFITLNKSEEIEFTREDTAGWKFVTVTINGPFEDSPFSNGTDLGETCSNFVFVCGRKYDNVNLTNGCLYQEDNCKSFKLAEGYNGTHAHEKFVTLVKTLSFNVPEEDSSASSDNDELETVYVVNMQTENDYPIQFQAEIMGEKLGKYAQIALAGIILVGVYVLIAMDVVHRAVAAFIGSTATLGVLSMIGKRPTLEVVVEWIDMDTICLLFGMMTLVGIFSQTGFFDYSAVKAYKLARGKVWPLITLLCLFSAVVSAFLDNVTTILLLTPVSIRLCQVLNLDPRPILIAEVIFSNIGGTATAVGDPPNVIIISNSLIKSAGINFAEFTLHLLLGVLFAVVVAYLVLTGIYYMSKSPWPLLRDLSLFRVQNKDPPHIAELKREIAIWERTALRLNVVSLEERAVRDAILAKAMDVRNQLNQEVSITMHSSKDMWQKNLQELESKYRISNAILFIKSSVVLVIVILLFFLSHFIPGLELEIGWIAIFGGVVLLILADVQDLETVIHKIEWGTLLFFAGLFVLIEGLEELGLISFIGEVMVDIIKNVHPSHQMLTAIILILWVSAIASSFIDNIPFTTATIPVVWELAHSPELCLSLRPLVWALAMGACLGGNGTLIGASANVVCAGIAEQNGYRITFMRFLMIGFPMMIVTIITSTIYLLICHSAADWDIDESTKMCQQASLMAT